MKLENDGVKKSIELTAKNYAWIKTDNPEELEEEKLKKESGRV